MEKGNKGVAGVGAKIAPFVMSINATNNGIVSKISKSTADTKLCKERCSYGGRCGFIKTYTIRMYEWVRGWHINFVDVEKCSVMQCTWGKVMRKVKFNTTLESRFESPVGKARDL